jgi:hypothetical protein
MLGRRDCHIFIVGPKANPERFGLVRPLERAGAVKVEMKMVSKISAVIAAAALIVAAGAASAQPVRHVAHVAHQYQAQAPEGSYYHFRGDASGVRPQADPLAGTVFEGVAPY